MKKTPYPVWGCLMAFLCACHSISSSTILFKTGNFTLSAAGYDSLRSNPAWQSLTHEQFTTRLTEEGRILSYAGDHQYDTIALLQQQLQYAVQYYASAVDGFVWNIKVKPLLQVTETEVLKAGHSRQALLQERTQQFIRESTQQVLQQTRPEIHKDILNQLAQTWDAATGQWLNQHPHTVVMEYDHAGRRQSFTVAQLMDFVQATPLFTGTLSDPSTLEQLLHSYLIGIQLYIQAQQLGIETDTAFLHIKDRIWHQIQLTHFKRQQIIPRIRIEEQELTACYQQQAHAFPCFASSTVLLYTFNDVQSALQARQQLIAPGSAAHAPDPSPQDQVVVPHDTTFHTNIITTINTMPLQTWSMPVKTGDHYKLIYLHTRTGRQPLPYRHARDNIRQLLWQQKEKELIHAMLAPLYPVTTDRISEYLSRP